MIWRQNVSGGRWLGPHRTVLHENEHTVWTTQGGKLFRSAPENVRPVVVSEAHEIPPYETLADISTIGEQLARSHQHERLNPLENTDEIENEIPEGENVQSNREQPHEQENETPGQSPTYQPDTEPPTMPSQEASRQTSCEAITVPNGENTSETIDDALFLTCEEEPCLLTEAPNDSVWRTEFEVVVPEELQDRDPTTTEAWMLLATNAKKQRTEVKLSTLTNAERQEFEEAEGKEVQNWLQTGTIARILRNQIPPEEVLRCRWILTWKPLDQQDQQKMLSETGKLKTHKAKARLVVLGYLDPHLEEIPRDSPTLSRPSRMLLLQLISSMQWTLQSFDIKAAFLQGEPQSDRTIGIQPVTEISRAMKLRDDEICYLKKGAYGLIDAPFQWFMALHRELCSLGFTQSPFDPCMYVLWSEESPEIPAGILGVHVDDGLCGGNAEFQTKLNQLEKKFPFGSKRVSSFTFTGIDLTQQGDSSITMNQSKYVGKIPSIKIETNRKSNLEEPVTENERQELRGLVGSLQYASVNTRPDLASKLSMLQSSINKATIGTLVEANRLLHEAKRHQDVCITIKPIPIQDFRLMTFSDASFASANRPDSHAGMIIVGTHRDITRNVSCPISPLAWGCRKIQKVVTSTLAAETCSLASALDQMSWLRLYWGWLLNPKLAWKTPEKTLRNLPEAVSAPTLKIDPHVAVTDCKSLFDLTTRTAVPSCSEFRVQLQARAIKELLRENTTLRWVHSAAQLADALTKSMESTFLRETLRMGRYRLSDEQEILKVRSNARDRLKWLKTGNACAEVNKKENLNF